MTDSTVQEWPIRPLSAARDVIARIYPPERFVGREWLTAAAERFRHDPEQRRLVVVGEPGAGKSAWLGYLASTWNAPRHFIRTDSKGGVTGASLRAFLVSLGFQLFELFGPGLFPAAAERHTSVRVGLASGKTEVIGRVIDTLVSLDFAPRPAHTVSVRVGAARGESTVIGEQINRVVDVAMALEPIDLLHVMLVNPLRELYRRSPDIRVPVLIDALDESRNHPGPGVLDVLPVPSDEAYPPNLKLLMTSRDTGLETFEKAELLRLDDAGRGYAERSREDAHRYLRARLATPPLEAAVAALPPQEQVRITETLARRSEGNFLYLFHVLNEIERTVAADPAGLSSVPVPDDLDGVYRVFALTRIQQGIGREEWTTWYEPVLGILAVAREAVDSSTLATLAGVDESNASFVVAAIRQFLDEADPGKYRIYHRDFADYLLDKRRNRDYPLQPGRYHQAVAAAFIPASDDSPAPLDLADADGYAIRHLTAHLRLGNLDRHLHRLLALTDVTGRNAWFAAKIAAGDLAGFTSDVEAARSALRRHTGKRDENIIRTEATYALTMSSIRSLTAMIPAPLVKALIRERVWSPEAALGYAASGADAESRATTAIVLLEAGPPWSWAGAREIVIDSLLSMRRQRERVIADFAAALTQLPADSRQRNEASIIEDLEAIVPSAADDSEASATLAAFAPLLSDRSLSRAKRLAASLGTPLWRAFAQAALAARGTRDAIGELDEAVAVAFDEAGNFGRAEAIGCFLRAGGDRAWAATHIEASLLLADDDELRWQIYANLIHLSAPQDLSRRLEQLLEDDGISSVRSESRLAIAVASIAEPIASVLLDPAVVTAMEDIQVRYSWLLTASRVVVSLPEEQRLTLAGRIIEMLVPEDLDSSVSRRLGNLGSLSPRLLDHLLDLIETLEPQRQADALGSLAACAEPPRRAAIAARALDIVAGFHPGSEMAEALGRLAPVLDEASLRRAVQIAETIGDRQASASHLKALIPYLREGHKERALRRAIALSGGYEASQGSAAGSLYGARFLRAMAPDMPASLIGDAVEAARNLGERVWRALALAALVPALPADDQPALMAEARQNLPDDAPPSGRAEVLAALAAGTHGAAREQLVNEALAETAKAASFPAMADAIEAVRPVLSSAQLATAVQHCLRRADRDEQAQYVVARFARDLPLSFIEESLSLFDEVLPENRHFLVRLLVRLAGAGQQGRARQISRQRHLEASTALPILDAEEASRLLAGKPADRMKVSIADRLIELGCIEAAHAILDGLSEPAAALTLAGRLAVHASERADRNQLPSLWQRCLDEISAVKRVHGFAAINDLAPVTAAIAGPDGPNGLLDATEQVLAWWP